jgi:hypothetical protein
MDGEAELFAPLEIAVLEGTDLDAGWEFAPRRPVHDDRRLLDLETERCIQRQ